MVYKKQKKGMSADGLKPLSRLGLSKVQPTASKSATDGSKISMGENHTQRVVAVPKRHARVPQAPTDCWPGNHGISAALYARPVTPRTA